MVHADPVLGHLGEVELSGVWLLPHLALFPGVKSGRCSPEGQEVLTVLGLPEGEHLDRRLFSVTGLDSSMTDDRLLGAIGTVNSQSTGSSLLRGSRVEIKSAIGAGPHGHLRSSDGARCPIVADSSDLHGQLLDKFGVLLITKVPERITYNSGTANFIIH